MFTEVYRSRARFSIIRTDALAVYKRLEQLICSNYINVNVQKYVYPALRIGDLVQGCKV